VYLAPKEYHTIVSNLKVVYVGNQKSWDFDSLAEQLSVMNQLSISCHASANFDEAMGHFYNQEPIILLLVEDSISDYATIISEIKNDEVFMYLPILLIAENVDSDLRKISYNLGIENFIQYDSDLDELVLTANSAIRSKIKLDSVMEKLRQVSEENISRAIQLDILRNYVPLSIWYRSEYLSEIQSYKIPEEERELAILFADLQGFSTRSERMQPREVVEMLNSIFDVAVRAIDFYGGDVDKFIGDALLAVFASPKNALAAAMKIQKTLPFEGPKFRIGIHYGKVIRGSVGGGNRWDYTLISDVVNTAQRLESQAPPGGILISKEALTVAKMAHHPLFKYRTYTLKGKANLIEAAAIKPKSQVRLSK
jgi:class 3 adenylate cyclase